MGIETICGICDCPNITYMIKSLLFIKAIRKMFLFGVGRSKLSTLALPQ